MAIEPERIHEDIVATRQDLEEKLERLRTALRRKIDLRRRIGERPWLALGGSIVAGYALGRLTRGARPSGARHVVDGADPRARLAPRALLVHAGFAVLSAVVHELIDRQVPRLVGRMSDAGRLARDGCEDERTRVEPLDGAPGNGHREPAAAAGADAPRESTRMARRERRYSPGL